MTVENIETASETETEALGARLARCLTPGTVIALYGDLGAGKTALVRGIAQGLGAPERVSSPTFTIVNEYIGGRLPLFHFDMYRLGGADELYDIGWEDYLSRGGVCAVEWSERVAGAFDGTELSAHLERLSDTARRVRLEGAWNYADLGV